MLTLFLTHIVIMKIILLTIGKTDKSFVSEGFEMYAKRISHYIPFEYKAIPDLKKNKNLSQELQKNKEAELIFKELSPGDVVVLLDEKGREYGSVDFSAFLQKRMNAAVKQLVFVIGGPYGFGKEMINRADFKLSLSKMTFSHQLVRVLFAEQLYRAFTILNGEPYHHD